jgi:acetyl-CoA C-acetyltransferase
MKDHVVVVGMGRTAVGRMGGALSNVPAIDLATFIVESVIKRTKIKKELIDECIFGNVENRSDESCLARWAAIKAGLPETCDGYNVQRLCGSGMQALHNGVDSLVLERKETIFCGGVENMSRYRYVLDKARFGYRMGDSKLYDTLMQTLADNPDPLKRPAAQTAENLCALYNITKKDQAIFAQQSQERAINAIDRGYFKDEIIPLDLPAKAGKSTVFDTDEHPRRDTSIESMMELKPIIKDGTVSAGTACGINDGASGMIIMKESKAEKLGLRPLARILGQAAVGVRPDIFGIGPAWAIREALKRASLPLEKMELIEINEAFAAQVIACERELGVSHEIVNVNGGAIALGHALGNSGLRVTITLLSEMARRGSRYGVSSLCIGAGMGIATVFERCN